MYCRTVVLEHAARKPADQLTRNDVAAEMVYTGKVKEYYFAFLKPPDIRVLC
jgi:hypothetical protein